MFTRRRRHCSSCLPARPRCAALPGVCRARAAASEFRIGWQKGGVFALAKTTGALEKRLAPRGVTVSWAEFTSGPPLLEALGANAIDFGSTGDIPPLFAQAAGGDLVYVAASKGSARRLGDPRQAELADPDARRPQGQEGRLQARLELAQFRGQGAAHGRADARRRRRDRPAAAGCGAGFRQ